jgi:uncharacterized protein YutE (UPF0331/DUF86 family)
LGSAKPRLGAARARKGVPCNALRLRKAVGFRNLALHTYGAIDWAIVHAIATRHPDDFVAFARCIAPAGD